MNRENTCAKIKEQLSMSDLSQPLPTELSRHLASCSECNREYETLQRMRALIVESSPAIPPLAESVTEQIEREALVPHPPKKTHRPFPVGTIAALAAVLAVYISVYHGALPDSLFDFNESTSDTVSEDESRQEVDDSTVYSQSVRIGSGQGADTSDTTFSTACDSDGTDISDGYDSVSYSDAENGLPAFVYSSGDRATGAQFKANTTNEEEASSEASTEQSSANFSADTSGGALPSSSATDTDHCYADESYDAIDEGFGVGDSDSAPLLSLQQPDTAALAQALYDELSRAYPDAISREVFEATEPQDYLLFAYTAVEDFDSEYNEQKLAEFLRDRETADTN